MLERLNKEIKHFAHRIEYINRLKQLQKAIKGSKLTLYKPNSYLPDWVLSDKSGNELARVHSRHVVWGLYNHFFHDHRR